MIARYPNSAKLFIKQRLQCQNLLPMAQLPDDQLLDSSLQLDEDCMLRLTSTNQPILLRYMIREIEDRNLTSFCYVVLAAFREARTVREVIALISERYSEPDSAQQELLQAKVLGQVREALRALLLIDSEGF
jgi:hypothetical protein